MSTKHTTISDTGVLDDLVGYSIDDGLYTATADDEFDETVYESRVSGVQAPLIAVTSTADISPVNPVTVRKAYIRGDA